MAPQLVFFVVGKPSRAWWRYRLFGSVVDDLVRKSEEIDVYVIRGTEAEEQGSLVPRLRRHSRFRSNVWSVLTVAAFDFSFVPPRFTFAMNDGEYLITFGVMLVTALVITHLTVRLRQQADAHREREERTALLYRMSREQSRATSIEEIVR